MNDFTTSNNNFLSMLLYLTAAKLGTQCITPDFSFMVQDYLGRLSTMTTGAVASQDEAQSEESSTPQLLKKKKDKTFICNYDGCGKTFDYKWILERHMNSHFCFKLFKCEHEGCEKAYKSKENLNLHIKNKHLNIKPYQCQFCNLQFSHRNGKHRKILTYIILY
jgi:hypothetical protein